MALQSLARPPSNENFQWALTDSNRRPSASKAAARNQLGYTACGGKRGSGG